MDFNFGVVGNESRQHGGKLKHIIYTKYYF